MVLGACGPIVGTESFDDESSARESNTGSEDFGSSSTGAGADSGSTATEGSEVTSVGAESGSSTGVSGSGPTVVLSAVYVEPRENHDAVREVARTNVGPLQNCYAQALEEEPSLAGRLTLELEIDPSGAAVDVEIFHAGLDDSMLRSCFVNEASTWTFELLAPRHTAATIPFRLSAP